MGKKPIGQKKKKKKKSTLAVGTLTTEEDEAQQMNEMLNRSTVEKMASNIPYLKGIGLSTFEL